MTNSTLSIVLLAGVWFTGALMVLCTVFTHQISTHKNTGHYIGDSFPEVTQNDLAFSNTLLFLGWMVGAPLCAALSDYFGRRRAFAAGALISCAMLILQATTLSFTLYSVARFGIGFAMGGIGPVAYVWGSDLILHADEHENDDKALVGKGAMFQLAWAGGGMAVSGIAYLVPEWRLMTWISLSLCALNYLLILVLVPESASWLKASAYRAVQEEDKSDEYVDEAAPIIDNTQISFLGKDMILMTAVLSLLWFTNSFVYYGLTLNAAHLPTFGSGSNIYLTSFLLNLLSVPGQLLSIPAARRFGNRQALIGALALVALMFSGMLIVTLSKPDHGTAQGLNTVLSLSAQLFITLSFTLCYIVTVESYPAAIRNSGMGVGVMIGRFGAMVCPWVVVVGAQDDCIGVLGISLLCGSCWLTVIAHQLLFKPIVDPAINDEEEEE